MYHVALRMLLGDRPKYIMLVSGLTFAALLMSQQCGVFFGLLSWTTSHMRNMRASIWVVDPKVEQINEVKPLRDTDVNRVRSVVGVAYAAPMYTGLMQARMADGGFKQVQIVGLDAATMVGRPGNILAGRLEDLRLPSSVMIDTDAVVKLSIGRSHPLKIGDVFEINDREARIIGICKGAKSWTGAPYIFTTYEQALRFAPPQRKMLSFVVAEPAQGLTAAQVARKIEKETGLKAFTEEEFFWSTIWWYFKNTGIPTSFGTTILLGLLVGIAVSGQTFYSFVLENTRHLAALKAMGASNGLLARMLLLQALTVGLIGYGLGIGLASLLGFIFLNKGQPPFFMPYQLPLATFGLIFLICIFAALLGIRRVAKLEAAIVFRG